MASSDSIVYTSSMCTNQHSHFMFSSLKLTGLVLERYITPYFFALTTCHLNGDFRFYQDQIDAPPTTSPLYKPMDQEARNDCKPLSPYPLDEWTLTSAFSSAGDEDIARKYLEIHYDNFVKREDIMLLKKNGVTHVRVPLGHWILGDIADDEPYVAGGWEYFKRLVGWCREEGIEVWPDLHTAPGSQNGFDNSGRFNSTKSTCDGWDMVTNASSSAPLIEHADDPLPNHVQRTLRIINDITSAIANDNLSDVVTGFGVLNEPFVDCHVNIIKRFYNEAFAIVRKNMGQDASVYIGDLFDAKRWEDGFWTDEKYKGTYLDSHYYQVFDEKFRSLSPRQHIAVVCQIFQRDATACCYEDGGWDIPSKGIGRIFSEWSASYDTLVGDKLEIVMSGIASEGACVATSFLSIEFTHYYFSHFMLCVHE